MPNPEKVPNWMPTLFILLYSYLNSWKFGFMPSFCFCTNQSPSGRHIKAYFLLHVCCVLRSVYDKKLDQVKVTRQVGHSFPKSSWWLKTFICFATFSSRSLILLLSFSIIFLLNLQELVTLAIITFLSSERKQNEKISVDVWERYI